MSTKSRTMIGRSVEPLKVGLNERKEYVLLFLSSPLDGAMCDVG